jgi:hypothetical protein
MMYRKRTVFFLLLLAAAVLRMPAQTTPISPSTSAATELPQWAKDLRRFEIIAFGAIPFAMFTATFAMDMFRWSENTKANGMNFLDFSDAGRRYAPWPLKSAGAVAMESDEQKLTITIAASLSIAVAVTDYIIVQVKRNKARKRAEALPAGSSIIIRKPLAADEPDASPAPDENPSGETDSLPPVMPPMP